MQEIPIHQPAEFEFESIVDYGNPVQAITLKLTSPDHQDALDVFSDSGTAGRAGGCGSRPTKQATGPVVTGAVTQRIVVYTTSHSRSPRPLQKGQLVFSNMEDSSSHQIGALSPTPIAHPFSGSPTRFGAVHSSRPKPNGTPTCTRVQSRDSQRSSE